MTTTRTIDRTFPAVRTTEGGGFIVHRPFPTRLLMDFDPFLLLDEMGPIDYAPGEAKGAPDHPHRGFETVTYALEGQFGHKDSAGHSGTLRAGDVQWMTAGAGVVHSEMPDPEFNRTGGRVHGVQLWVNLPREDKMIAPRYQEIPSAKIPVATSPDGAVHVKVIAGEALGVKAAIETRTPILYQHFTLQPGASIVHAVPRDYRVFAYALSGKGMYGEERHEIEARQMVVFNDDGDTVTLAAGVEPLEVLLLGGVPLKEPVVRYGPFVMNTEAEIRQAVLDYQAGRMGQIAH
ncbi:MULTISPECIES: pirin family protein [Paraburkholderia]|uniref:pirin family protein n=1 Tax=Paraburkholderia TaxID=1822464 RepID=UPI00225543B9|nr:MULTISPECIES: pirin family protein [Paraburkholderia]MCX4166185.1 pirin family protein [Paraburkholderia megapolitana]MDN7161675.1 pirin family protein [Paraburkholderia sp. CHISQ3]MDQ6498723.1 pirin family protein [Paraburkholderia megapolitana]